LAVDAGDGRHFIINLRIRQGEDVTVGVIDPDGDVTGDFNMLFLILADRNFFALKEEDVGGHEDRIGKESVVGGNAARRLVFKAVATFEEPHRREVGEDPGQLLHLGEIGLYPEGTLFRIHPQGKKVDGRFHRPFRQGLTVTDRGHGVIVGDEAEELLILLIIDHLLHHAEVVTEMEGAGRLNAGEHAHNERTSQSR